VGISDFLAFYGYSTPLTIFLVKKEFLLHRPVFISQPRVNSTASENHRKLCQILISQLGKIRSYEVSMYISVTVEGFRRWRGCILALE
jgi:hypothetical protein